MAEDLPVPVGRTVLQGQGPESAEKPQEAETRTHLDLITCTRMG